MGEISWEDFEKQGTVFLRDYLMEGVDLEEIAEKDGRWCAARHLLLAAAVLGGLLHKETLRDDNPYAVGYYSVALEQRLSFLGFHGVKPFASIPNMEEQLATLGL